MNSLVVGGFLAGLWFPTTGRIAPSGWSTSRAVTVGMTVSTFLRRRFLGASSSDQLIAPTPLFTPPDGPNLRSYLAVVASSWVRSALKTTGTHADSTDPSGRGEGQRYGPNLPKGLSGHRARSNHFRFGKKDDQIRCWRDP
jgi:hypothetical protein